MKEFKINSHTIIERDNVSISHYLCEINHIERISPEEEARLTSMIKKGGREGNQAKEKLIKANLRFVVSVANQYKRYGMELPDLISEGNIGLVRAAELFDETRGFKFISYAVWWIRQSIMTALANNGNIVRVPLNQQKIIQKYHRMQKEMLQNEQRALTISEFAEQNGYDECSITGLIHASSKSTSIDTPVGEDSDATILDLIPAGSDTDKGLDEESLKTDIDRLISSILNEVETTIIRSFYGLGCTALSLEDIADKIGKSRERTRQLCAKAIEKLRNSPYSSCLIAYLAA